MIPRTNTHTPRDKLVYGGRKYRALSYKLAITLYDDQ